jgi:hypothetical protein
MRGGRDGDNSGIVRGAERLPQLLTPERTAMSTEAPSVAGDCLGRRGGSAAVGSGTEPLHVRCTTLALTLSRLRRNPVGRELFSAMATLGNRIRASVAQSLTRNNGPIYQEFTQQLGCRPPRPL